MSYLGHILSAGQVQVNPEKLEALQKAPTPKNAKEVKAYVGLLNYFRNFIPSLAEEVRPLYALLKKDVKFQWTIECDEAFNRSKLLITKDAYLKIFDPAKPTLLLCDASPVGVSAVLMQRGEDGKELPVHYASMALTQTQQNYAQLHREGLAIIYGLKKFYQYLYGRKFTIVTDAQSIKEMFSPEKATPAVAAAWIQRWYPTQFIFDIIHRSSNKMCVPDALSRLPLNVNDTDSVVLMKKLARSLVYWPGLDRDIENWIQGCKVCQELSTVSKKKVITKWPPSTYAMERIHIDFFFYENRNFLLVMGTFTKYIEISL